MSVPSAHRGIRIDASMWPLIVITFGVGVTDDDWKGMFKAYDGFYERREPFHVVNDRSHCPVGVSASQRRLIGEMSRLHEEETRRWCLGGAVVIASAVARGVLTAITWLAPPVYKLTTHATLPEAVDEALVTFRAAGIEVPRSVYAFRSSIDPLSHRSRLSSGQV